MKTSFTVGQSPQTDFSTIQSALDYLEQHNKSHCTLLIEQGVYNERLRINTSNTSLIGLGEVVVQKGMYALMKDEQGKDIGTFQTYTCMVNGDHVTLKNMTIANTAGQGHLVGQAVALHVNGNYFVSKNCRYLAYQDTVFLGPLPKASFEGVPFNLEDIKDKRKKVQAYFEACYIEGTVDFIFGGAQAYFDKCQIHSLSQQREMDVDGYISATCTYEDEEYGFVFNECILTSDENLNVFLGRPWRPYAHTVFQNSTFGSHINEALWEVWSNEKDVHTTRYYDRNNTAKQTIKRIEWSYELKKDIQPEDMFDALMLQSMKG